MKLLVSLSCLVAIYSVANASECSNFGGTYAGGITRLSVTQTACSRVEVRDNFNQISIYTSAGESGPLETPLAFYSRKFEGNRLIYTLGWADNAEHSQLVDTIIDVLDANGNIVETQSESWIDSQTGRKSSNTNTLIFTKVSQ